MSFTDIRFRRSIAAAAAAALLAFAPFPVVAQDEAEPASDGEARILVIPPPQAAKPLVAQDYEPSPAIWKLADEDTTIYLFGTIHTLPRGFRWRSEKLKQVLEEADELVLETADNALTEEEDAFLRLQFLRGDDQPAISELLSEENAAKWLKLLDMLGPEGQALDRMNPLFGLLGVGVIGDDLLGSKHMFGVESYLEPWFESDGKQIGSIEHPAAIVAALLAIEDDIVIPEIEKGLAGWDGASLQSLYGAEANGDDKTAERRESLWDMEHSWAKGEPLLADDENIFPEGPLGDAIHRILIVDRNAAWTQWLIARLDEPGTVLVAVGASHFYGEDSVLQMLAERGYEPPRVD